MIVFGEEHEVGDVLATADFHLTGTGYKGLPVDAYSLQVFSSLSLFF